MLELATLGLLLREPLHGYRLKQQLELLMSSCISVNYGAIYPLLKRLEEREEIATVVESELDKSPSTRKIYSITDLGRDRWRQEMLDHPQESWVNTRSRFLIKFLFFSYLESSQRIHLLEYRLMVCKVRLASIKAQEKSEDCYQIATLEYCTATLEREIEWIGEQLEQEFKKGNREQGTGNRE
jgi:DNA-binding PadR family transcriptional regulator